MTTEIRVGSALSELQKMPDKSVHMGVSSPPYYGLRDYGVEGQIGLEKTPEEYIANLVAVYREHRRVLRDDGTLWINMGDSYASAPRGNRNSDLAVARPPGKTSQRHGRSSTAQQLSNERRFPNLKAKDLIGIPWMLAFALRADGWYLRSDIIEEVEFYCPCGCGYILEERIWRWSQDRDLIWRKANPMPESVTDRPTKSHEYVFLLSKSERYYYDGDAIREPISTLEGRPFAVVRDRTEGYDSKQAVIAKQKKPSGWDTSTGEGEHGSFHKDGRRTPVRKSGNLKRKHRSDYGGNGDLAGAHQGFAFPWNSDGSHRPQYKRALELAEEHGLTEAHIEAIRACGITDNGKNSQVQAGAGRNTPENLRLAAEAKAVLGGYYREFMASGGRNKRSVWTVTTQPYKDAHFATFPPKLIEPCILAGSPRGGTVLDCFSGAGTTGLVCDRLERNYIGIELNPEYAEMSRRRIQNDAPLFHNPEA